jgi:hypothetical protein
MDARSSQRTSSIAWRYALNPYHVTAAPKCRVVRISVLGTRHSVRILTTAARGQAAFLGIDFEG